MENGESLTSSIYESWDERKGFSDTKEVISVALGLEAKKEIVAEVSDVASRALSVAVAEYRGMEVADLTDLVLRLWARRLPACYP